MTQKTLVIGLGAQKGGSSWLHSFLGAHPDCYMSNVKELHYFTQFELKAPVNMAQRIAIHRAGIAKAQAEGQTSYNGIGFAEHLKRLETLDALFAKGEMDLAAYLAYLHDGAGDAKVVGEVTPAYALLSEQMLGKMHAISARTKMIYVMRDPIARLWSNLRMRAQNKAPDGMDKAEYAIDQARKVMGGRMPGIGWRSDYAATLQRIDAAIPAADIHLDFFEDLFGGGAARVCDFLEIDRIPEPLSEKVNKGVEMTLPRDLGRDLMAWLLPQYDAVRARFGKLPAPWEASLEAWT